MTQADNKTINKQTKFLVNRDFKVLSPLTKESAQYWGEGTKWKISAEKFNDFDFYNRKAPLFIVITPDDRKFQVWRNNSYFYAFDKENKAVEQNVIEDNWQSFFNSFMIFFH